MKRVTMQTYRERMLRVMVHIQEHLDEALNLEELARIGHFSPFHFHRVFRAWVGEAVHQHVRRLRLERAAVMLRQTDLRIVQVALESGFETHEAFSRAFKGMFGVAPSRFRDDRSATAVRPAGIGLDAERFLAELKHEPQIKRLPARRIAFVRHVGPYDQVGGAFDALLSWAASRGLLGGDVVIMGICYDHPEITPEEKIRYDAALTVDDDIVAEDRIGVRDMPGGDHLVVCHEGPYGEVGETYDFIYGHWLPSHGRVPSNAPPFEVYLNDPESTDPQDLLTDVYVPLVDDR